MTFLLTAHCMENGERIVDLNSLREKSRFKYKPERCGPVPDWTSSPDPQRRADHLCTDGRRSRTSGRRRRRRRRRRDTRQKNRSTLLGILTHSTIEISPFTLSVLKELFFSPERWFRGRPETEISLTKVAFEKYIFKDLNNFQHIFQK